MLSAATCDHDAEGVWPGQELVLLPPPVHHQRHVEAKHEGEGDVGQVVAAVQPQRLERLPPSLPSASRHTITITLTPTPYKMMIDTIAGLQCAAGCVLQNTVLW